MKMSSEQFADEMIKDFAPKIKPVTKSQVEEVEEKLNQKMKEAAAKEEPDEVLEDDPEPDAPEYEEDEAELKEDE